MLAFRNLTNRLLKEEESMASEKQISANRRNAKRSTGPVTAVGKSISRRNSQRHGLSAAVLILLDEENPEEFEEMRRGVFDQWQPGNTLEEYFVAALAAMLWRYKRAMRFEAAAIEWKKHDMLHADSYDREEAERISFLDPDYSVRRSPSVNLSSSGDKNGSSENVSDAEKKILGRVIEAALTEDDLLAKIARHEAHLLRQIERILDQLRTLKAEGSNAQKLLPVADTDAGSEAESIAA